MKELSSNNRCQIFIVGDTSKRPKIELIFLTIKAIFEFLEENEKLPKLNCKEDAEIIIQKTKRLFEEIKIENNLRYYLPKW